MRNEYKFITVKQNNMADIQQNLTLMPVNLNSAVLI